MIAQKKRELYKASSTDFQNDDYDSDRKDNDVDLHELRTSAFDFESLKADNLYSTILERRSIDTIEKENESFRQLTTKRLKQLFNCYQEEATDEIMIEYRHEFEAPSEFSSRTSSFVCKCTQLKFELDCEPIFAQLALYDLKARKKISENFHFDLNSEHIKYMLRAHHQYNQQDPSTLSQTCAFNVTCPNEDIYLVIRLEKVLQQGDIAECVEPYVKIQQLQSYNEKQSYKEKFHLNAIQFCERLGKYRMPFAWTAINLMNILNINTESTTQGVIATDNSSLDNESNCNSKSSSLDRQQQKPPTQQINENQLERHLNSFKPVSISINSFFKQDLERLSDADLFKYLAELKKSSQSSIIKKLKCINGVLKMEFSPFNKHLAQQQSTPFLGMNSYFFINSSLQRLKYSRIEPTHSPQGTQNSSNQGTNQSQVYIVKDLLEFSSREVYIPNYTYRNLLYIYPLEINFNNRQMANSSTVNSLNASSQQQYATLTGMANSSAGATTISSTSAGCSARNIVIRVQLMKDENENYALPLLFSKSSTREFSKEIFSTVLYHNKTPQYYDELKLKLPAILTDANYHLLFTFSHVSCNLQKFDETGLVNGGSSSIETIIGYSWLPLLQSNDKQRVINSGIYTLPIIFNDKLQVGYTSSPSPYIYSTIETDANEICHLKSYFQLKINLQSTIHTQDLHLDRFINISNNILMNDFIYLNEQTRNSLRNYENIESLLRQSLIELHLAQGEPLVKFIFILLDKLFNIMMIFNTNISQLCLSAINRICIKVTNLLVNENDIHLRNKYLVQYIRYTCNLPYKTVIQQQASSSKPNPRLFHEELCLQLIKMLKSPLEDETLLSNLWFFLELLFKSMCFYVLIINNNSSTTTNEAKKTSSSDPYSLNNKYHAKFTKPFIDNIIYLVKLVIIEILHKNFNTSRKNFKLTSKINANLAFFLYDCFSIFDRALIFQLIQLYMKEVSVKLKKCQRTYDLKHLYTLKLDFLRILCSHEHFIALNTPIPATDLATKSSSLLSQCTYFFNTQAPPLASQQQQNLKITPSFFRRYFLLGVLLKNFYLIFNCKTKTSSQNFTNAQVKLISLLRNLFESHDFDDRFSSLRSKLTSLYIPFLIIILNYISFVYETKKQFTDSLENTMNLKHLLICVLWMFKNFDKNFLLLKLAKYFNYDKLNKLLQVLDLSLVYFEYKKPSHQLDAPGNRSSLIDELNKKFNRLNFKLKLEDLIVGTQNARSEFMKRNSKKSLQENSDSDDECVDEDDNDEILDDGEDDDTNVDDDDLVIIDDDEEDGGIDELDHVEFGLYSTANESALPPVAPPTISSTTTGLQKQSTLRWRKDQLKFRLFNTPSSSTASTNGSSTTISRSSIQAHYNQTNEIGNTLFTHEANSMLSTECTLIVLDTVDVLVKYIQQIQQKRISISSTSTSSSSTTLSVDSIIQANYLLLLTNIFKLILNALSLNQSVSALKNIFAQQRILVSKYPELIFDNISFHKTSAHTSQQQMINNYKNENSLCSDLCNCLLKYSISSNLNVRSEASASIYALLKQNYDISNNFTRAKISLTIAFNNLINQMISNTNNCSENELQQNELFFKKSLRTVYAYTDYDMDFGENFILSQIQDLVLNLNCIMTSMIRIKTMKFIDNEMYLDLMYRVAGCYTNTPNLRLIWLQNMAQKHLQLGNLVEAGHCLVHAAALIAEYLSIIENKPYLPIGCTNFKLASVNVIEESAIYEDILLSAYNIDSSTSLAESSLQQQQQQQQSNSLQYSGRYFTESGLINLIEQSAVFLIHSQHYEVANQLYKILIPVYEAYRDYKKLAQIHSKLNDCFNKIMVHGSKRLFGTYFRVGFYGKLFEELDGEEFVYKEPGITKLSEIANRIESFYNEKFSPNFVEIMKDSNNVDRKVLLESKVRERNLMRSNDGVTFLIIFPHLGLHSNYIRGALFRSLGAVKMCDSL